MIFEKNLNIPRLLDIYGDLLTDRQRALTDIYYNEDLSLSEIAENEGITRAGARDIIKKAENKLLEFENKLHILRDSDLRESVYDEIASMCDNLCSDENCREKLEKIKRKINELR